jgi:hypothetical protein
MVFVADWFTAACGAVRVATGFLRAELVLVTYWLAVTCGAVRVATRFSGAELVGL